MNNYNNRMCKISPIEESFTHQSNMEHCSIPMENLYLVLNTRQGVKDLGYGSSSLLLTMMSCLDNFLSLDTYFY